MYEDLSFLETPSSKSDLYETLPLRCDRRIVDQEHDTRTGYDTIIIQPSLSTLTSDNY